MSYTYENAIEITEHEYNGYKIIKTNEGWKILKLNKVFDTLQKANSYINAINSTIEDLYIAACSGDYDKITAYFDSRKTAQLNRRYKSYKGEISLVMAALNNKMYDICTYLLSIGETVTDDEFKELEPEISRAIAVTHIFQKMR
ncbi:MAG: hypothetical protein J1G06_01905 [Oscillospiraceae bacterium]|nr:hypothetical protein [Oscillospiraceae bacterium]